MANAIANNKKGFDNLPVIIQLLIGIFLLLLIAAIGFGIFYLVDILLLDVDPIKKLVVLIADAVKGGK